MGIMRRNYVIQENGQVTLPVEWRDRYGLKKGDLVSFEESPDGSLKVIPRAAVVLEALDAMAAALQQEGITLEQLLDDNDTIRAELYRELYGKS
jgi:AbrB family looped-hinge helix DNA binding protein